MWKMVGNTITQLCASINYSFSVDKAYKILIIKRMNDINWIPNSVVGAAVDGQSMLQAWREYLKLTQVEMAERMGITQAGYAQIEAAKRPRKATLQKAAEALGISLEQLAY